MFTTNMPKMFWSNIVLTFAFLINRMSSCILSFKTPLQQLQNFSPTSRFNTNISLKIFGCTTFLHVHHNRGKLDPRASNVFLLAILPLRMDRCYDPSTKHTFTSLNIIFFETTQFYSPKTSLQGGECERISILLLRHVLSNY